MDLPAPLRQAVDEALQGIPPAELARAAEALSKRYRAELRDGRRHLDDDRAALAYLATRLPATYAAVQSCLESLAEIRPGFAPRRLLDAGAGPGTALWAAAELWPRLERALLIEGSPVMRKWGERLAGKLATGLPARNIAWKTADLRVGFADTSPHDLVVLAYVLDELEPAVRPALIDRLWAATGDMLLLIEPGTPAGWQRILAARERLLAAGATIVAPCPHAAACPLQPPDWCHFARRVARSPRHRQAKTAELPWEDEKFIYLAVSRLPASSPPARVLAHPRAGKGHVRLKLCLATGKVEERVVSRREGARYKTARSLVWGDIFAP
ncbi:MAG TPA: small ribosomal subunit Rsm22 family protein [Verrucomicrobiae bacterium]|nr:small ribosomal subunit Rsm22 family protein [Verrucomicrobiae bacterium]